MNPLFFGTLIFSGCTHVALLFWFGTSPVEAKVRLTHGETFLQTVLSQPSQPSPDLVGNSGKRLQDPPIEAVKKAQSQPPSRPLSEQWNELLVRSDDLLQKASAQVAKALPRKPLPRAPEKTPVAPKPELVVTSPAAPSTPTAPEASVSSSPQPASPPPQSRTQGWIQARRRSNSRPAYPDEAIRNNWQGEVSLRLYISPAGSVQKVEIVKSSGHPLLDDAAARFFQAELFEPAREDGVPVFSIGIMPVPFRLTER